MSAFGLSSDSCAQSAVAITPANSDLAHPVRSLYVGVGGDLKVTTVTGQEITFVNVQGGFVLPVSVKRVWATGTTVTNVIGLS